MGIQGLLPQLKSIMAPINAEELRGQTVAVDTYSWLHKGALSCSVQLCKGLPTSKHIDYCMHRVNMLRHHGVKPILIFDGGLLPMKSDQEMKRARARKENLERAMEHEATGNSSAAYECYQKAVDISPSIAFELIQVLKQEKVDYIVAPYEADAQMTFLSMNKLVDAVITEDSDLIPFGCSRIIFKMDKFGQGVEFQSSKLGRNKELDFTGFTKQMLLEMCVFSGCDYLQSLPGMGVKRAHALVQKLKNYEKVIKHLRYSAVSVPPLYEETFKKAIWAFQHQRVYDPVKEDIVHVLDVPHDLGEDLDFLGPWLPQNVAKGIAQGDLDPLTKMPFQGNTTCTRSILDGKYSMKESAPANGRKRIDLPVQKNLLTNYFSSLEAKRKFRAPKVMNKQLVMMESSSPSSENPDSNSPISAEETVTYAINQKESSLPKSGNFGCKLPAKDSMEVNFSSKSENLMGLSLNGDLFSSQHPSLMEPKHETLKPFLASHVEQSCNPALDPVENNTKSVNRKIIVRSKFFRNKLLDANDCKSQNEDLFTNKENACEIPEDCPAPKMTSPAKKRKLIDVPNVHREPLPLKHAQRASSGSNVANLNNKDANIKAEGNFGCDISHLNNYTDVAEKSMEKFALLISSFRYSSSGSRASGLRAPLKDVQNACPVRTAVAPIDISKFAYKPRK
ncbi:exonuclease 1 isoform X2 [Elaeis guineensis]|uniref:Exonuclease 1 n=1 Tax=Elaeis guineensis var. tenera TaxID=51953 RepID=A0A6J0PIA7_ELAGV|nr:exonuclease 1 isoform X2 [Elaeis guineensis]